MRKLTASLATAGLLTLILSNSALAADIPKRVYKAPPPPPPPMASWTGFYVGGNLGAARTRATVKTSDATGPGPGIFAVPANVAAVAAAGTGPLDHGSFFTGGGQIGFNWQFSRFWLLGLEADINSLRQTSTLSNTAITTIGPFPVTSSIETEWLATFRARAGLTFNNLLVYATGGLALTKQTFTQSVTATLPAAGITAVGSSSVSSLTTGWTYGGGLEYLLWRNWSIKGEYLFAHFNGLSNNWVVPTSAVFRQSMGASTDYLNVHIARVGLNYQFR